MHSGRTYQSMLLQISQFSQFDKTDIALYLEP